MPFGIAFGDWEFHPWTIGAQRYLFYENPYLIEAIPNEVKIGKMAEIFVKTDPQRKFFDRKLKSASLLFAFFNIGFCFSCAIRPGRSD